MLAVVVPLAGVGLEGALYAEFDWDTGFAAKIFAGKTKPATNTSKKAVNFFILSGHIFFHLQKFLFGDFAFCVPFLQNIHSFSGSFSAINLAIIFSA
jgi:hypothetical protein